MIAKFFNENCACRTLDTELLKSQLESDELLKGLYKEIIESRPNLFSSTSVFISPAQFDVMTSTILAIEETISNAEYIKSALKHSPSISQMNTGTKGVFMGYDFHLSDQGPKLIEINTNAGGALLNLELAKAQQKCSLDNNHVYNTPEDIYKLDRVFFEMFRQEWKRQKGDTAIGLIAIVDDNPKEQYLYPEFQLFQRLFSKFGINSVIADAKDLIFKGEDLWYNGDKVDLVYNRLTDFYLDDKNHLSIRQAYETKAIVLTPTPYHHAIYANKTNLATLSSEVSLESLNIPQATKEILLAGIPRTEVVNLNQANDFWDRRRDLFFKPVSGFGSKATYRGDKITHKVWNEIINGDYVAQALVQPSTRLIQKADDQTALLLL